MSNNVVVLVVLAEIASNGACSLSTFVPFTIGNASTTTNDNNNNSSSSNNVGFSHMGAAYMAMEHFNTRNASVVPELANIQNSNCNVFFNMATSTVYDTGSMTHQAAINFVNTIESEFQNNKPCAIAGPYHDLPARDLSILALSFRFPQVAYRVFDPLYAHKLYSPYSLSVFPDTFTSSQMLIDYIVKTKNRSNFISILYSRTAIGIYKKEALTTALENFHIKWMASPYINPTLYGPVTGLDIYTAMSRIQQSGYRTIIITMDNVELDIQGIADACEALQMNQGEHFYVFQDMYGTNELLLSNNNTNITKLLSGSGTLVPVTNAILQPQTDPFYLAWTSQGQEQVERLNAANPIAPGEPGYYFAENDFFQSVPPDYGAPWMYDAVMSIGIAACQAVVVNATATTTNGTSNSTTNNTNTTIIITSQDHLNSLLQVQFTGATGHRVAFGGMSESSPLQARLFSTLSWIGLNILPPTTTAASSSSSFSKTDLYLVDENNESSDDTIKWEIMEPFYYRDGRTVPPDLLRDEPEQNYLSEGLRITGFVLLGIAWACALASALWVFLHRQHRVVKASQPTFLYILVIGAIVEASAIIPISFDESYGWNTDQLGKACMAIPWLLSLGHIVTYAALFTKLWRVNKVLQFSRRKVEIKHVVGPMVVLVLAALLILSLWTGLDPLQWNRVEINEDTGESIGRCSQQHLAVFVSLLIVVVLIPTLLTLVMAWKTKDVDEAYSESKWIFALIIVQLEVILFAVPIVALIRDVSTDGRYLGLVIIYWTLPMSTLALIMLPKVRAQWTAVHNPPTQKSKRGESVGVKVSGLAQSEALQVHYSENGPQSENHSIVADGH